MKERKIYKEPDQKLDRTEHVDITNDDQKEKKTQNKKDKGKKT